MAREKTRKIQTTRVYAEIDGAVKKGYTTISEQGSSRSSKTYNTLIWLVKYCLDNKNTRLSIVRKTLPSIKGSVLIDFKEILARFGEWREKDFNKTELTYRMRNGSWVEFFATDSEQKLRGRKRDVLYANEANELSFMEWQQLKLRTTKFAIVDYNPSFSDEHWLCELNKDPRTYHFITTYKDNPFLEQAVIDEIESLRTKNKTLWQVYGLGLQAVIEGLIFKSVEVVEEIPEYVKRRYRGLDFGYANDPTAIVTVGISGEELYIDEEVYRTQMLTAEIIAELKKGNRRLKAISESADPRLVQEIYRAGVNIHAVQKFKGSVMAGITKMLEYRIKITRRSVNVQKEFRNYTYAQDKEGKWLNEPIDVYNHAIDAVRYVILEEVLGGAPRPVNMERLARAVR